MAGSHGRAAGSARKLRTIFVGATGFGLKCLEELVALADVEVVGVITNEESFSISYSPDRVRNVLHADFVSAANDRGIPCYVMRERMSEPGIAERLAEWNAALCVVVGWYHMIPRSVRDAVPAIGLHASLLPDYSGGAPLVWAIINGEKRTGITLFYLGDGVDDGDIIGQSELSIEQDDTIATLYGRVEPLGLDLLRRHLPEIARGTVRTYPQDEARRRTFPQRRPEDGAIDWRRSSQQIYDFIRAQTKPYPGAFTFYQGKKLHIWVAQLCDQNGESPGLLTRRGRTVLVYCGRGTIRLELVGWAGRDMHAADWCAGNGILDQQVAALV